MTKNHNFGELGVQNFVRSLHQAKSTLERLDISDCQLGLKGISNLFEVVKGNTQLKQLTIDSNQVLKVQSLNPNQCYDF